MLDTETLVINDIKARQQLGIKKYGLTVADSKLTERQWAQHHYEELLDAAIYVKRRMQEMDFNRDDLK